MGRVDLTIRYCCSCDDIGILSSCSMHWASQMTHFNTSMATTRSTVVYLSVFGLEFQTILSRIPIMSSSHGNILPTEIFKK